MKYFTISELCASSVAKQQGIDNTPTKTIEYNLTKLVDAILDPLRVLYGKPIIVSSGYRSPKLNKAVGGASSSQHLTGQAADIYVRNSNGTVNTTETRKLYDLIVDNKLPYDQVILEKGTVANPQWIHVSYDETRGRRQKLYFNGKSYVQL